MHLEFFQFALSQTMCNEKRPLLISQILPNKPSSLLHSPGENTGQKNPINLSWRRDPRQEVIQPALMSK